MERRFFTVTDVADMLQITPAAVRSLINSGQLKAIQVGGRGLWRIEESMLNDFIEQAYQQTQERLKS